MTTKEYNECVDKWSDGVFRFILKNLRHEEDARDVVQNAFEVLWKNHTDIAAEKAKSYLFTTAYHQMIDLIRKQKRVDYVEEIDEGAKGETQGYQADLKEVLDKALLILPDIQRHAILLRDYEGYSYEEIGDMLQLTESQVKVYIFRARQTLKKHLVSIHHLI